MLLFHIVIGFLVVEGPSVEPSIGDEVVLTSRRKIIEIAILQLVVDQFKRNVLLSCDY